MAAWVGPALFAVRAWWRDLGSAWSTRGSKFHRSTRGSTLRLIIDGRSEKQMMAPMTITDYLINAVFVLIVFRQARERELDRRSVIIPLAIVAYVAHLYVHSIPTVGNDLVLIGALGAVGLALGIASGFATQVRAGENGLAVARVGWIAGALLIAGIGSRMVFAFALSHGAYHAVASFSIARPDRHCRVASGARADGAPRGQHSDRDRPAPDAAATLVS